MIAKGCKYGNYIPFLWSHNRKEDLPPIGRVMSVNKRNNKVKTKVQFADTEFADSINRLYTSDPPMMEKVSVGFITEQDRDPNEDEKKKGIKRVIEKWELLEVSAVPIPANPNAGTERDREMRMKIKDAVDSGEIQLPDMVCKDFGFEEKEDVIESDTGIPEWEELSIEEQEEEEIEENETEGTEIEEKPYENEHSCRLNDPGKYVKFNRKNCEQKHDGKCIDVIYGRKKDGKSEIQALRYPKKIWNAAAARSHCKSREGSFEAAKKDIEEQPEKDYIKIIKPEKPKIKIMKESPNIGLEKLAQNEDKIKKLAKVLAKELAKDFIDSWCGDFRKNVLGIVDD